MAAGRFRWSTILVALCLTACSAENPGTPQADSSAAPSAPAPRADQEDQADWAVSTLDPCLLLQRAGGFPGQGTAYSPRSCTTNPDDDHAVVVQLGDELLHEDRARGIPIVVGGLQAYQFQFRPAGGGQPQCREAIPLSYGRAVWIFTGRADPAAICSTTTAIANGVATILRTDPASASAKYSPTSPARWPLCRLRDKAFGPQPENPYANPRGQMAGNADADRCAEGRPEAPAPGLTLTVGPDPVTTMATVSGSLKVPLGAVTGVQYPGGQVCALSWAQDRLPNGSAQVLTIRFADGRCPGPEDYAKVTAALATPPASPAPAGLGFAPGWPDEATDPICRIAVQLPEDCRPPKPVAPLPHGTAAVLKAAAEQGADVACAMLATALKEVTGKEPLIAYSKIECFGVLPERDFDFKLRIGTYAPGRYFTNPPPPISVGGYPAIDGGNQSSFTVLEISPNRDLDVPGALSVFGSVEAPPGVDSTSTPPDPARLDIVRRVAESVLRTYFA